MRQRDRNERHNKHHGDRDDMTNNDSTSSCERHGETSPNEDQMKEKLLRKKLHTKNKRRQSEEAFRRRDNGEPGEADRDEFGRAIQPRAENADRNGEKDDKGSDDTRNGRDYDKRGRRDRRISSRSRSYSSDSRSSSSCSDDSRRSRSRHDGSHRHRDEKSSRPGQKESKDRDRERLNDHNGNDDSNQRGDRDDQWRMNERNGHAIYHQPLPPTLHRPHETHQSRYGESMAPPYQAGDIVHGVITRIETYGAFVTLDPPANNNAPRKPFRGLIHVSALRPPEEGRVEHPSDVVRIDERVTALVLEVVPPNPNEERGGHKIRLSLAAIDPYTGKKRAGFVMPPPRGNPPPREQDYGNVNENVGYYGRGSGDVGRGGGGGSGNGKSKAEWLHERAEERRRLRLEQDAVPYSFGDDEEREGAWRISMAQMMSYHRGVLPPTFLVWDIPQDDNEGINGLKGTTGKSHHQEEKKEDDHYGRQRGGRKNSGSKRRRSPSSSSSSVDSNTSSSASSSSSSDSSSEDSRARRRRRSRRTKKRRGGRRSGHSKRRRSYSSSSESSSTSNSSSSETSSSSSGSRRSYSRDRKKSAEKTTKEDKAAETNVPEPDDNINTATPNDLPIDEDDLREAQDFKKAVQGGHHHNGSDSDSDESVAGPQPLARSNQGGTASSSKAASSNKPYGSALLPGEGEALAQYVQQNLRIPRRGEIGYSSHEIENYEKSGYVMSGSRHARMNAVRIRKENQIYSAEEQRALALITLEENQQKESALLQDFREMLKDKLKSTGGGGAAYTEEVKEE
ncbi:hypothetical protein ACHAW6_012448 [Cyclotella cf. meneghiniana]